MSAVVVNSGTRTLETDSFAFRLLFRRSERLAPAIYLESFALGVAAGSTLPHGSLAIKDSVLTPVEIGKLRDSLQSASFKKTDILSYLILSARRLLMEADRKKGYVDSGLVFEACLSIVDNNRFLDGPLRIACYAQIRNCWLSMVAEERPSPLERYEKMESRQKRALRDFEKQALGEVQKDSVLRGVVSLFPALGPVLDRAPDRVLSDVSSAPPPPYIRRSAFSPPSSTHSSPRTPMHKPDPAAAVVVASFPLLGGERSVTPPPSGKSAGGFRFAFFGSSDAAGRGSCGMEGYALLASSPTSPARVV